MAAVALLATPMVMLKLINTNEGDLMRPLLIIIGCVLALAMSVFILWKYSTSEEGIPTFVTTNARGPIILPLTVANPAAVSPEQVKALMGKDLTDIIKVLGNPSYADGVSSCWWSIITVPGGTRHVRMDSGGSSEKPYAARIVLLTDHGIEEATWGP